MKGRFEMLDLLLMMFLMGFPFPVRKKGPRKINQQPSTAVQEKEAEEDSSAWDWIGMDENNLMAGNYHMSEEEAAHWVPTSSIFAGNEPSMLDKLRTAKGGK